MRRLTPVSPGVRPALLRFLRLAGAFNAEWNGNAHECRPDPRISGLTPEFQNLFELE
jgi:hypothetical protein